MEVGLTNGHHVAFRYRGRTVYGSYTESDRRAVLNVRAKLRRTFPNLNL